MKQMKTNCAGMEEKLADMLLDPHSAPAKVQTHVAECDGCRTRLEELRATMNLMGAWQAPEPSPYFVTRLGARMREEREAEPAGWFAGIVARLRARIAYGSGLQVRPLAAMALSVMLLVGGGAYLGFTDLVQPAQPSVQNAAVVHDLQTLDNNAQVLDQLEALSTNSNGD
jgi:hypothetical protein